MLSAPTKDKLRTLKLHGMFKALEEQEARPGDYKGLDFEERIGLLIDRELTEQDNRRMVTRIKAAGFREGACLENLIYDPKRELDRSLIKKLATCHWVNDRLNILVTGSSGAGKSYVSEALAHRACLLGYAAFNIRAPRMYDDLSMARGDGQYKKVMRALTRPPVLVIDDFGLTKLTDGQRQDLLEIVESRYHSGATIITSQLPIKEWHECVGNATYADAILDRLVHNAYTIDIKGDSMRKASGKKRLQ